MLQICRNGRKLFTPCSKPAMSIVTTSVISFAVVLPACAQQAPTSLSPIIVQPQTQAKPKLVATKKVEPKRRPVLRVARRQPKAPVAPPTQAATTAPVAPPAPLSIGDTPLSLTTKLSGQTRAQATSLQLGRPDKGGSRLNLTPLQTPASVDVISAETIQERGSAQRR